MLEHVITKQDLQNDMYELGMSKRDIASKYNIGKGSVQHLQKIHNLEVSSIQSRRVPENVTEDQKQLVLGTSLADGHLFRKNENREAALKIVHSVKQQSYLDYKYEMLKEFTRTSPTTGVSRVANSVSVYKSFRTLTHPYFTQLHAILYVNKNNKYVKIISQDYLNMMNEKALAVAYMDDGTKHHKCRDFCFECFSFDQQTLFCNWLKNKFNIRASLMRCKDSFITRINKDSVINFNNIIGPFVIKDMKYKL